ncbi:MAG: helix-turn-helix transcriptional regulator [Eubacteriales bacterium]|nr:helix-turn-helix transcriptional regulator [Eubacteriales bacterium]
MNSGLADRFGRGESTIVAGRSGIELCLELFPEVLALNNFQAPPDVMGGTLSRSAEYWTGWTLAYYQWKSGRSFYAIEQKVKITVIFDMYMPYHEMDIERFCEKMDELCNKKSEISALKRLRKYAELTQKELAEESGIPVRTIQQYEQGQKDLSKAQASYILNLSRVLCCDPEDLCRQ